MRSGVRQVAILVISVLTRISTAEEIEAAIDMKVTDILGVTKTYRGMGSYQIPGKEETCIASLATLGSSSSLRALALRQQLPADSWVLLPVVDISSWAVVSTNQVEVTLRNGTKRRGSALEGQLFFKDGEKLVLHGVAEATLSAPPGVHLKSKLGEKLDGVAWTVTSKKSETVSIRRISFFGYGSKSIVSYFGGGTDSYNSGVGPLGKFNFRTDAGVEAIGSLDDFTRFSFGDVVGNHLYEEVRTEITSVSGKTSRGLLYYDVRTNNPYTNIPRLVFGVDDHGFVVAMPFKSVAKMERAPVSPMEGHGGTSSDPRK